MIISELKTDLSFNGLSVLYNIARVLGQGGNLEKIMLDILQILEIHAGMNRGMISILTGDADELVVDIAHGISDIERKKGRYRLGEGITGKVVESGKPIIVPRVQDEPAFLNKTGARTNLPNSNVAFLCVPIKAGELVVGALSVDRISTDEKTLNDDIRFLEAIADLIAQAVDEHRKNQALIAKLEQENLALRRTLEDHGRPEEMIGNSGAMRDVFTQIGQVAPSQATALIRGETGTGKELVARAIHDKSTRHGGPFVAVNCAALPESLIESELFGHEKGAFTGATAQRIGRFESANNGTLFLDEIGEMPLTAQSKLLRAIQEKEIQRVGGLQPVKINVRLICATNRDLEEEVRTGRFREDLFYRVNVFMINLPALRNRGADVLLLADYFVKKYALLHGKEINRLSTPAIDMLSAYHWPGNVRELENVIERAVIVATNSAINGHDLPPTLQMKELATGSVSKNQFESLVTAYEKELITDALKDCKGNQSKAAKILGITKRIIQYKITKYGIEYTRFKN